MVARFGGAGAHDLCRFIEGELCVTTAWVLHGNDYFKYDWLSRAPPIHTYNHTKADNRILNIWRLLLTIDLIFLT